MVYPEVVFKELFAVPIRNGIYKKKEFHGSGVPIVNMGDIFATDRLRRAPSTLLQVTSAELQRFHLERGDLLFGRRSLVFEGSGKCALVDLHRDIDCVFESSLIRVRLDTSKADPDFMLAFFLSPQGRDRVLSIASQTAVSGIRGSDLALLPVPAPPIDEQRRLGRSFRMVDALIENNRRRVEILGEMARLIYREWFVHFGFPGHEDLELVDSDLGPIPDGWSVRTLDEVAEVNARTLRKADLPDEIVYIDISSVEPRRIGERSRLTADEAPGRARRVVVNGDVIWSTVRPNRRAHALVLDPEQGTIASTGLAVLSASSVPSSFLFEWSSTNEFTGYLISRATGSAYPAVRPTDFEEARIVVPTDELLAEFDERVGPMHQLQATLSRQNEVLREARDLLLPRLVSGELDVSELDLELAEVG